MAGIDGLLCLTQQRVYFQPRHPSLFEKPVINVKIQNVKQLFKRRCTLMDLGLEIVAEKIGGFESSGADPSSSSLGFEGLPKKQKIMFIVFESSAERDFVYKNILENVDKS